MSKTSPRAKSRAKSGARQPDSAAAPSTTPKAAEAAPATTNTGRTLTWSIWILYAEAVAAAAVTILVIWDAITGPSASAASAAATTAVAALLTLIFGGLGFALSGLRKWARGPAIVLEMLLVPLGYTALTGGLPMLGIPLIVVGVAGAGLLLAPATRTALGMST